MKGPKAQQRIQDQRRGRRVRVRKKIYGTEQRPRFSVFRSNRYIHVQIINDDAGATMCAISSRQDDVTFSGGGNSVEAAKAVGLRIAQIAQEKGITHVVFDKGWYRYHGRIKALADAAREAGLQF